MHFKSIVWTVGIVILQNGLVYGAEIAPFQSWTLSSARLSTANAHMYVVFDSSFNQDCIWLVSGSNCYTCVDCYNKTSDELYTYDTLAEIPGGRFKLYMLLDLYLITNLLCHCMAFLAQL